MERLRIICATVQENLWVNVAYSGDSNLQPLPGLINVAVMTFPEQITSQFDRWQ